MDNLQLIFFCWIGTCLLYLEMKTNGRKRIDLVKRINQKLANKPIGQILDVILFTTIGTLIQYVFVEPSTIKHALAAGLAWSGTIGTSELVGKISKSFEQED